jgi:hypothetical protein
MVSPWREDKPIAKLEACSVTSDLDHVCLEEGTLETKMKNFVVVTCFGACQGR